MDAKFCQDERGISFDSTKISGPFNEISWRTFVQFSREIKLIQGPDSVTRIALKAFLDLK